MLKNVHSFALIVTISYFTQSHERFVGSKKAPITRNKGATKKNIPIVRLSLEQFSFSFALKTEKLNGH